MVLFKKKVQPGEHEIVKEGSEDIIHINYETYTRIPSIEDDPLVMSSVIEKLTQSPSVNRIIFHQNKKYEYSYLQTQMLIEVSQIFNHFIKQKSILTKAALEIFGPLPDASSRVRNLQYIILSLLKTDPIGAYVETKRLLREEKINLAQDQTEAYKSAIQPYISVLSEILELMGKTRIIEEAKSDLDGYVINSREVYKKIFHATITPDFMYTRLASTPPLDSEAVDSYSVGKNSHVQIFNTKDTIKPLYHVIPPEFQISEDKYELLELARKVLAEHQPKAEEFIDPDKMRVTFFNIGKDLITELAEHKRIPLTYLEIEELAQILVRYTVGFGLIETLLHDEQVQDIAINSPPGNTPMFLVHGKYDECITNIVPSAEDVEGWASKFRLISARPLDEANPVLDTELILPNVRARVAIISRPLNPTGIAFSIRRHRDKPWTLPLFIQNGMINDLAAGLLSFIIDGSRTLLVAGTRSSGKTSLLGSVLVEVMRKYRVIIVEDSVTGDSEILIKRAGKIEKTTIGELIDSSINNHGCWYKLTEGEVLGNYEDIEILAKDRENKIRWAKPTQLMRHRVNKKIYEIKTRTGKILKVTEDHSLFSLSNKARVIEIKPSSLSKGAHIATPRKILLKEQPTLSINLLDYLERMEGGFITGEKLKEFIKKNYYEIRQLAKEHNYSRSIPSRWLRKGILPIKILKDLNALSIKLKKYQKLYLKSGGTAEKIPIEIKLDNKLLTLMGIWLADGCYGPRSIIFSTFDKEDREVVEQVGEEFGLPVKIHSDGGSRMINSISLKFLFYNIFELRGNAYTKQIPNWLFNLSKEQISFVLKGLFSGDGHVSNKEIKIPLSSSQLLRDIQTLLLGFEIRLRIGKMRKDKTQDSSISTHKDFLKFRDQIGLLQEYKMKNLEKLCNKISTHDTTDIIPLNLELKERIRDIINNEKIFNSYDYITRDNNIGREKLSRILSQVQLQEEEIINLELLNNSDIFWDEIKEINLIELGDINVYDLAVPECESFICNNIIAHNTRELPVDALSDLGYDIQPMKVRSALLKSGSELGADEGIRTSLRMGDSALIVGEVRSSIRGTEEVLIIERGITKRIQIKDLEGKDISNICIPSMDFDLKFKLKKLVAFVKHPKRNKLLEVITRTGRKITVTPDHSLFTHKDFRIVPIECQNLGEGTKIIIPERLPCNYNNVQSINLFEILGDENCRVEGYEEDLRQIIKKIGWKKATELSSATQDIYQYLRKGIQHNNISILDFKKLTEEANQGLNIQTLQIKKGTSGTLAAEIEISKDFCRFLGYYVAEGYTQKSGSVVLSNGDQPIIRDIINLSKNLFGINPYVRQTESLGVATQISLNNKILGLMIKKLGCGRIAIEKRIPSIIFGLSEDKICEFLKGYFDGDGCQTSVISSGNRVSCSTISKGLANDLLYLFLQIGIVARIYEKEARGIGKHISYIIEFKQKKYIELFLDKVGFKKYKKEIINKQTSHSNLNTLNYDHSILEKHVKIKKKFRHLRRYNSTGKEYLRQVVEESEYASDLIKTFVNGDFFLDEVKSIKEINLEEGEFVYDLSVEPCQNFIGGFGGIILHNTEALALFEAMRTGALANTVAGTIHGDSPYGVFDRLVNDLQVPRTSFKATDIIVIANPVKSADGLHRYRRVTQITEVRKEWEQDPLAENGFIDLMKYDSKLDTLVPTDELLNGDTDIIKSIASQIKEWAGDWNAVWENILLRAKIKKTTVDYSKIYEIPDLMEAKAVIQMNDEFHRICDRVRQETDKLDSEEIFSKWELALKEYIKINYKL